MKIITSFYKRLAIIECSCCRENHTLKLELDKDDKTLWFTTNERYKSFFERLKTWFKIKINRYEFIHGKNINYFELLLKKNQLKEIVDLLEEEGYVSEPTNIIPKNIDQYATSYFNTNGILLGVEDNDIFILALHLRDEDDDWNFTSGQNCCNLEEKEVGNFLYIIKHLIGENNDDQ